MANVDIVRPASTTTNQDNAWEPNPSGASVAVRTSDENNSTGASHVLQTLFAQEGGTINTDNKLLVMAMQSHTPTAGTQRHRIRGRAAVTAIAMLLPGDGNVEMVIRAAPPSGVPAGPSASSWVEDRSLSNPLTTPWSSGSGDLDLSGGAKAFRFRAIANRTAKTFNSTHLAEIREAWIEIDCREQPSFAADVLDGAGSSQADGDIADTARARLTFGDLSLDGLPARSWSVSVEEQGTGILRFQASGTGEPDATILTSPLAPGSYTAKFNLASTIRVNDAYDAAEQEVDFALSFVQAAPEVGQPNTVSGLKIHYTALPRKRGERGLG